MKSASETILHIDLKKLEENFQYFKEKISPKTKIIAVVKAFAYGHGDVMISKKLETLGLYAFWVSDFEEGIVLRQSGIKTKIIVANPGLKSYNLILKNNLDVVLYNHNLIDLYCSKKNKVNVHVKFNTGMNRYGFDRKDISIIVRKIKANRHLKLNSICSHLAASEDETKKHITLTQIKKFQKIGEDFELYLGEKIDMHILNSHGIINFQKYEMSGVRIGIGLYGAANNKKLKEISSLTSVITQITKVKKGDFIGYGLSFIAKKNMTIAVIPVGYADGLNRKLSNLNGSVFVKNKKCSIIGKISMDSCMIDISEIDASEGEMVEIFGQNLSVVEIADKINTIPYEIYSTLNRRIKRIYSD